MENGIWGTGILVAVLVIAVFFALRTTVKRMSGKSCCAGKTEKPKRELKILESEPDYEITVEIGDLCCENCAVSVENAFNRMEGVSATASHKEKRAVLLLCREMSETEIRLTIAGCGFTAGEIQIKKL
ncbi:MAG: hypothetical protein IJA86_03950 [Clostridia bacterium]|nr:hypothetical protein [Clostridia bacterium]